MKQVKEEAIDDLSALEVLAQLEAKVITVRGVKVFKGRRLRPEESKEVKLLLERAMPPLVQGGDPENPQYDFRSPGYLRDLEENKRAARAVALWSAFPVFKKKALAGGHSAATAPEVWEMEVAKWGTDKVTKFIEQLDIDEDILEALFAAVMSPVLDKAAVGFTSGSSFPKS